MTNLSNDSILKIVYSEHHDPFTIMGIHFIDEKEKKGIVIRLFYPGLKTAVVVEKNNPSKIYEMNKLHEEGFYEIEIKEKNEIFDYYFKVVNNEGYEWGFEDSYKFLPVLGEQDLYYLNQGKHYKSYEKLGSHLITHYGVKGVHFCVWAPAAKRVSVVGDFNKWDGRIHQMRVIGNGFWELFIPDLVEGELYKYEIKTVHGTLITKRDPYAFFSEITPQTASIIYNIEKYTWTDKVWMNERKNKNTLDSPISIYEVHLGSWQKDETGEFLNYKEVAHKLATYIKEMGYTHIELLPITEHPFYGSWGYQVTGYFSPTSRYGNPDEFMYFMDYMHQNNIGVILDWVPAHFPKDDYALARFDGTGLYEHEDPRKGEHKDWGTYIYNYGRYEVRNFLISNALFWLDKYHIDGLRVDAVASMLYLDYSRNNGEWIPNRYGGRENLDAIDFIKEFNENVYKYYPDTMTIAEESTAWPAVSRPLYTGGLGFGFKWNMGWMHDILDYMEKDPIYRTYHHSALTFSLWYAFHENFILPFSHDEVVYGKGSMINKMSGDWWQKFANVRLLYTYMFTHPGKKLTFMGMEIGQWKEWNHDTQLDWNLLDQEYHKKLNYFVKDLNHFYKNNPALYTNDFSQDGFEWIDFKDSKQSIISYIRKAKDKKDFLICVLNFTPVVREGYRIGVPEAGKYKIELNTDSEYYGGGNIGNATLIETQPIEWQKQKFSIEITVPPLGAIIIRKTE